MARIEPTDMADKQELQSIIERLTSTLGITPNSMRILAHRPEILIGFKALTETVSGPSATIPRSLKSLVSQMVSRSSGCGYCIAHTTHGGERSGISEEKEAALWDYETSELFADAERAAIRVARGAGLSPNCVTDEDFEELRKHLTVKQVVEIVAVIALYGFYNRFNDTMATELEAAPLDTRRKFNLPRREDRS